MAAPIDLSAATTLEAQVFQAVFALQEAEKAVTGDNPPNNVQATIDTDDSQASMTLTMDISTTNNAGNIQFAPVAYIA